MQEKTLHVLFILFFVTCYHYWLSYTVLQCSSSTSSSLQINEPEPLDSGKIEEEEDYYMEDDCDDDDDGYDEDDYEFDEADFNQHLADKFDDLDLPPGVEATVPWLQKIAPKEEPKEPPKSNNADENANKYKQFKQFDTIQNFSDHHFAKFPPTEVTCSTSSCS